MTVPSIWTFYQKPTAYQDCTLYLDFLAEIVYQDSIFYLDFLPDIVYQDSIFYLDFLPSLPWLYFLFGLSTRNLLSTRTVLSISTSYQKLTVY